MACIIYDTLEDYNLLDKLHCITTDNASNNYALTKELSKKLRDDANIHWNHETHHLPCLAHVINLVVRKFLTAIKTKPFPKSIQSLADDDNDEITIHLDIDLNLENFPAADAMGFRSMLILLLRTDSSLRRSNKR